MNVFVVTVARSDFGIYEPLLREARRRGDIDAGVVATGMHLSPEFGLTVRDIEAAGYPVAHRVEMLLSSDSPAGTAASTGVGILGFAGLFSRHRPDWLVVLGDRFEMFAAVSAALPFRIPVAHLHGGELTFGAIDDAMRHAITKMSHLHFASTAGYAARIRRMGEEPWRVFHSGALSLEDISCALGPGALRERFGVRTDPPPLLVTFHPVTLEPDLGLGQLDELFVALDLLGLPAVVTLPNADPAGREFASRIRAFAAARSGRVTIVENFGREGYFGMMKAASVMVGNSSSGLLEAGAFGLPCVNIGDRQAGRTRGPGVIDCEPRGGDIAAAVRKASGAEFRSLCSPAAHPYFPPGGVRPSSVILDALAATPVDRRLLVKKFDDGVGEG